MALTREILLFSRLGNLNRITNVASNGCLQVSPVVIPLREKHYNPNYKWHRGQKFIPIDLPDFHLKGAKKREQRRAMLKEFGIHTPRYWKERPMTITSIPNILNPYIPREGDGKYSSAPNNKTKELIENLKTKKDTVLAIRKIKSYEDGFSTKLFPQVAQDIYIKAHTLLMNKDPEELMEVATDRCISEMLIGVKGQTIRWNFIKSLEPPVVVHARTAEVITKTNLFAQVTVRFHTQQTLAIYDRFGRLMYGSETVPKDVLEYVVFEKHIVNVYGAWRVHGKIIPDWLGPTDPSSRTYIVQAEEVQDDLEDFFDDEELDENLVESFKVKDGVEEAEAKS